MKISTVLKSNGRAKEEGEKPKKGREEKRQERYKIFIYMSFARATCNPERPLCQVLLLLFAALVIVVTVVVVVVIVVAV